MSCNLHHYQYKLCRHHLSLGIEQPYLPGLPLSLARHGLFLLHLSVSLKLNSDNFTSLIKTNSYTFSSLLGKTKTKHSSYHSLQCPALSKPWPPARGHELSVSSSHTENSAILAGLLPLRYARHVLASP